MVRQLSGQGDPAAAQTASIAMRDFPDSVLVATAAVEAALASGDAEALAARAAGLLERPWYRSTDAADALVAAAERDGTIAVALLDWFAGPLRGTPITVRRVVARYAGRSPRAARVLAGWDRSGDTTRTDAVAHRVAGLDPASHIVLLQGRGDLTAALTAARQRLAASPGDVTARRVAEQVEAAFELTRPESISALGRAAAEAAGPAAYAAGSRPAGAGTAQLDLIYAVNHSLPQDSSGYATRTHSLLRSLIAQGYRAEAVSRPGFAPSAGSGDSDAAPDLVDNVRYHRLAAPTGRGPNAPVTVADEVSDFAAGLIRIARRSEARLIHAASNYRSGLAATLAAEALGIASVYEVRGLWEWSRASSDPRFEGSDAFEAQLRAEVNACLRADHVLTITEALRSELADRGVPAERISVLPNAVDISRFQPRRRDDQLAAQLGIGDRPVIGYVGSINDYEGLDLLLAAASDLRGSGREFAVLIVGDGPALPALREQAERQQLQGVAHFAGRVPHADAERYYSLIDIAPLPRLPLHVSEIVSPLKPFEAMAMGKAVVVSSVAALAEIVADGVTGRVVEKGSAGDLARALGELLDDEAERRALGVRAREWVAQERDWPVVIRRLVTVYERLGIDVPLA